MCARYSSVLALFPWRRRKANPIPLAEPPNLPLRGLALLRSLSSSFFFRRHRCSLCIIPVEHILNFAFSQPSPLAPFFSLLLRLFPLPPSLAKDFFSFFFQVFTLPLLCATDAPHYTGNTIGPIFYVPYFSHTQTWLSFFWSCALSVWVSCSFPLYLFLPAGTFSCHEPDQQFDADLPFILPPQNFFLLGGWWRPLYDSQSWFTVFYFLHCIETAVPPHAINSRRHTSSPSLVPFLKISLLQLSCYCRWATQWLSPLFYFPFGFDWCHSLAITLVDKASPPSVSLFLMIGLPRPPPPIYFPDPFFSLCLFISPFSFGICDKISLLHLVFLLLIPLPPTNGSCPFSQCRFSTFCFRIFSFESWSTPNVLVSEISLVTSLSHQRDGGDFLSPPPPPGQSNFSRIDPSSLLDSCFQKANRLLPRLLPFPRFSSILKPDSSVIICYAIERPYIW